MERIPKPGEFYRHTENKLYQIVSVAEHTETGEKLVVYQALYGSYRMFATPLSLFNAKVDKRQYPQVQQEYCFEPVKFLAEKETQKKLFAEEPDGGEFLDGEFFDEDGEFEELVLKEPFEEFFDEDEKNSRENQENTNEKTSENINRKNDSEAIQWLERFLDADGYEKQLEVLSQMRGKVGNRELGSICLVLGIPVLSGDEETQLTNIRKHLETRMHYDTRRLR